MALYNTMANKNPKAKWNGDLKKGDGNISLENGTYKGTYSFESRFEGEDGTDPEELMGAAHAGCYSMALSAALVKEGFSPKSVQTEAEVSLEMVDSDPAITTITLKAIGNIPDIDRGTFQDIAKAAKNDCPVSKALTGVNIKLNATLKD